eukprot:1160865-Pelagomonas_calceolata.AAC.7
MPAGKQQASKQAIVRYSAVSTGTCCEPCHQLLDSAEEWRWNEHSTVAVHSVCIHFDRNGGSLASQCVSFS